MPSTKLTNSALAKLNPGVLMWDTGRPGLGVRAQKDGPTTFLVKYRIKGSPKTYRRRIGDFTGGAGGMSIDDARDRAFEVIQKARSGADPFADAVVREEASRTFGGAFEAYLAAHQSGWSEGHYNASKSRFDRFLRPSLGTTPLADVRRGSLNRALERISAGVQRNRTATLVTTFFRWAVDKELVEVSPAEGMKSVRSKEKPRARTLIDQIGNEDGSFDDRELRWLLDACKRLGRLGDFAKFVILTGARIEEASGMTADEIDRDRKLWVIKAGTPKRNKSGRDYFNVLPDEALAFLPDAAEGLIWTGERGGKLLSNPHRSITTIREEFEAAARRDGFGGEVEPFGFHDLRRTLVTWLQRKSCDKELRDAVTNHKVTKGADASYAHSQRLPDQRRVLSEWADYIGSLASEHTDATNKAC